MPSARTVCFRLTSIAYDSRPVRHCREHEFHSMAIFPPLENRRHIADLRPEWLHIPALQLKALSFALLAGSFPKITEERENLKDTGRGRIRTMEDLNLFDAGAAVRTRTKDFARRSRHQSATCVIALQGSQQSMNSGQSGRHRYWRGNGSHSRSPSNHPP